MKRRILTQVVAVCVAVLALAGCSNSKIDTAKVREALASIDGAYKPQLDEALTNIDAGKFKDAVLPLKKIAFGAKLDKDQVKILKETMTKVQANIAKAQ